MSDEGHVQEYPCDCQGEGHTTCWILRHPKCVPPISYPTKEEAENELERLRAGGKTINELLEEFGDPPFTAEDYRRELAEVNAGFLAAGVKPEDIEPLIRDHNYIHDGGTIDTLAERWISLMSLKPYIDEE